MDANKRSWAIASICGFKNRINTNPDFQRPSVWGLAQKQLLMDTILRNLDIPKLYLWKIESNPDRYNVVDGQQRLRAIWDFQSGNYKLAKDAEPVDGYPIASLIYSELPDDLRIHFDIYNLDVVVMTDTNEDEVREMFLRLQNGTSLKAQEKRNALSGNMRNFIKTLADHPFFKFCDFANSRYTFDHIAAQMTSIELEGGPCNVKNANLNKMYADQINFDANAVKAKKVRRVLDYLLQAFPEKTPELGRYNAVSLYIMISHLLERYVIQNRQSEIAGWFISFESYRRAQDDLPEDKLDPELVSYHDKISHSTDSVESLTWRHDFLMRKLFEAIPNIELKDNQRLFTSAQRLAIFRRDGGFCKVQVKCKGEKCVWENWEADHITPWSKGGKTTVENGQVACLACNSTKSNS